MVYRVGLIGYGLIARAQHIPTIAGSPDFELTAVASRRRPEDVEGVRVMDSPEDLIASPEVDVVSLCTPPHARIAYTDMALAAGKHVLLEKPPAATLGEAQALLTLAQAAGRVLFASWHSQFNSAIPAARAILDRDPPKTVQVVWHEDVVAYHAGQQWIWEPGGFGVFDAGINALSILSKLLPDPVIVKGGRLLAEAGHPMPIAALVDATTATASVTLDFDWRTKTAVREITVVTQGGKTLFLPASGRHLRVDGVEKMAEDRNEYPRLYRHFAQLLAEGRSDADIEPLRIVADIFLMCRRHAIEP